jgi:hypothetical protein
MPENEDRPNYTPSFQYQSDEIIVSSPSRISELNDERPVYYNYRYDQFNIFQDDDVIDLLSILDEDISVFSIIKETSENGVVKYHYREGERESQLRIELTNTGSIQYEKEKLVGFTDLISNEQLLKMADRTRDEISIGEDFKIHLIHLVKISEFNDDRTTTEIGSFYWVSFDQFIDGLQVRNAYVSLDIRNEIVIGYRDHRFHDDNMVKIEEVPNLYSSDEASSFAIDHVAKKFNFEKGDLSVENWELLYGFDESIDLITPIYTFRIAKEHRSYYTQIYADMEFEGKAFTN